MNIAFFITPKSEIIYEYSTSSMRQALERMEFHTYTAIPIIDKDGKYIDTLTEGDLLWMLKNNPEMTFKDSSNILIKDIPKHVNNIPVSIASDIEDLILLSANQNFVPVVDDQNIFIGIIKRSKIIDYLFNQLYNNKQATAKV